MAAIDQAVGNAINDFLMAGAVGDTSGTLVIPAAGGGSGITLTKPYNVVFDATLATATVAGTAITGTSSTPLTGKAGTASATVTNVATKANDAVISITTTSAVGSPWNGIRIMDSTGTPKRVLFGPTSALGKTFASGDILSIPVGNASLTIT
jgi:hypothetical protein